MGCVVGSRRRVFDWVALRHGSIVMRLPASYFCEKQVTQWGSFLKRGIPHFTFFFRVCSLWQSGDEVDDSSILYHRSPVKGAGLFFVAFFFPFLSFPFLLCRLVIHRYLLVSFMWWYNQSIESSTEILTMCLGPWRSRLFNISDEPTQILLVAMRKVENGCLYLIFKSSCCRQLCHAGFWESYFRAPWIITLFWAVQFPCGIHSQMAQLEPL